MWLLIGRSPAPDAPYWRGRRWLGVVDAVAWPVVFTLALHATSQQLGIVGPMSVAVALLVSTRRVYRALFANHRYRFTTWRWAQVAAALLTIGLVLKILTI